MNIKELLQTTPARITLYDRWLVLTGNEYTVYERKPYARNSKIIYTGTSEKLAVDNLYVD